MKRHIIKPLLIMGVAGGLFLLSSCLKNNKYYVNLGKYSPSMELPLAATNTNGLIPVAMGTKNPAADTFDVVVNVASVHPLNSPQTATIALDTAYLSQYNAQQEQADSTFVPYEVLPDSVYTVNTWNLTVPAGQRQAFATITIAIDKMDATHNYVLPFTIVKSSLAISNWNHEMLNIQEINQYAGTYSNTYSGDLGSGNNTMTLSTVNASTCSSNLIGVYSNPIYFTVNPDNSVTVLDALGGGNSTTTDPSSHYDPGSQTYYLNYKYYGSYHIVETLTLQ